MPLILGTNSIKDTGYDVANSLRFNRASSDKLERTPSSASNRRTYTFSCWFKLGNLASSQSDYYQIFGGTSGGVNEGLFISDADQFYLYIENDGRLITNQKLRDTSAWYHVVMAVDTTNSTADNRLRLYLNGSEITSYATRNNPTQNYDSAINNNTVQNIGERQNDDYFDGYMAEVVMVDGQQLDATSFGEFDSDSPTIWKPIDVSGLTFGTNGFYLDFENASSLGADVSGNSNNFTVNNLTSIDQSTDTCTNNFCTLNPLQAQIDGATLSEGNTKLVSTAGSPYTGTTGSTMAFNKGKWYHEVKYISAPSTTYPSVGFGEVSQVVSGSDKYLENAQGGAFNAISVSAARSTNNVYLTGSGNITYSGSDFPFSTNDILMVAIDYDNDKIWWGKNGTWLASGDPANGTNPSQSSFISAITPNDDYITPYFGDGNYATAMTMEVNFGNPSFSISSGNSDGNGYGNFEYAVPSGYYALNTKNLAEYGWYYVY